MKIIIADDEIAFCNMLEIYMKEWLFDYEVFKNGSDALQRVYHNNEPILLLLDWEMPGLSGLDICNRLNNNPPDYPIYIILLTGKTNVEDLEEAMEIGASDFIRKPFQEKELHSRILAGKRILELQNKITKHRNALAKTNKNLEHTLEVIKQDEEAGRTIQRKILPKNNTTLQGCTFTHTLLPSLYLSGDFLDYFKINDDCVGFYFIDVAGHGSSSAFVAILLKSYISGYITRFNAIGDQTLLHPKQLLEKLNQLILNDDIDKHFTIFYGILKNSTHELIYSNGGQFPFPILLSEDKKEFIVQKSLPLGLIDNAEFQEETISCGENFCLYLFSDGILDIINHNSLTGKQEILFQAVSARSTNIDLLIKRLQIDQIDKLPDDITLLKISKGCK